MTRKPIRLFVLAVILAVLWMGPGYGDVIYDVTFENPPHTNGLVPTYGEGMDRPNNGSWFVVSNGLSGFSSQAAVVDDYPGFPASMEFVPSGVSLSTGVHVIEWDWEMLETDDSVEPQSWMALYPLSLIHI